MKFIVGGVERNGTMETQVGYSAVKAIGAMQKNDARSLQRETIALLVGFIATYGLLGYQIAVGYGIYLQEKRI